MILAILDLQVSKILPTKFQVNWPFGSEDENRFSKWLPGWPSWFLIGTILPIFDLQVTPILPIKF